MIATINPAGCGGRARQIVAAVCFAAGSVLASALVGAAAGVLGALAGAGRWVLAAAALLALAGALRESGAALPLPQARRQVPERWRRERPLPLWASGYGAGLGAGVLTHQPVSTFWVALAAAVALGDAGTGAACLSAFGVGRAAMAVGPGFRRAWSDADDRLPRHAGRVRRVNAVALGACALALTAAAAAPARASVLPLGAGSQLDASASGRALAYTLRRGGATSVVVTQPGQRKLVVRGASRPALDGDLVAVQTPRAVELWRWRRRELIGRVPHVTWPALAAPYLAVLQRRSRRDRLVVVDLRDGSYRVVTTAPAGALSRPAISTTRLTWGRVDGAGSRILLAPLPAGRPRVVARSRVELLTFPALSQSFVGWLEVAPHEPIRFVVRRLGSARHRTVARLAPDRGAWTTALAGRTAFLTLWRRGEGSRVLRVRF